MVMYHPQHAKFQQHLNSQETLYYKVLMHLIERCLNWAINVSALDTRSSSCIQHCYYSEARPASIFMKASLFSMVVVVGLPKAARAPAIARISKKLGPSPSRRASSACAISVSFVTETALLYPQAFAIVGKSIFVQPVGCPPTESCTALLIRICLKLVLPLWPAVTKAPMCMRAAPSPSMRAPVVPLETLRKRCPARSKNNDPCCQR